MGNRARGGQKQIDKEQSPGHVLMDAALRWVEFNLI